MENLRAGANMFKKVEEFLVEANKLSSGLAKIKLRVVKTSVCICIFYNRYEAIHQAACPPTAAFFSRFGDLDTTSNWKSVLVKP